jgi:two-component system chemotaxis response regulator CheB
VIVSNRDIVVIGASAGGVEALQQFVKGLPTKLEASIFVSIHFPERSTSVLPRILSRANTLPAIHAVDGESIVQGRIYVAPPDHHLLLSQNRVRIIRGPRENGHRPAIDPMFRSAAIAFGPRVIGVILTGNLDDGTSGLAAVKRHGGLAFVQDPEDALFPSMPQSAIEHVAVDRVAPLRQLAKLVIEATKEPAPENVSIVSQSDIMENELAAGDLGAIEQPENHPGRVSGFSCPDCGGVLWEIDDGEFVRFRCRVGHAWTGDALLAQQSDIFEDALWVALRSLEESASLSRQLAAKHRARQSSSLSARFEEQAEYIEKRAAVIRAALAQAHGVADRIEETTQPNPRRAS